MPIRGTYAGASGNDASITTGIPSASPRRFLTNHASRSRPNGQSPYGATGLTEAAHRRHQYRPRH